MRISDWSSDVCSSDLPERRTSRDESFPLPVAPDPSRHSPVLSHNGKGPLPPIWLAEHQATRSSPIGCQRAVCPGHPNQAYAERNYAEVRPDRRAGSAHQASCGRKGRTGPAAPGGKAQEFTYLDPKSGGKGNVVAGGFDTGGVRYIKK